MAEPRAERELLERYLDGRLSPAEREAVEEAASQDPELRRALVDRYRDRSSEPERAVVPEEVLGRVRALGDAPPRAAWRRRGRVAVLAAALAAALGLGLWLRREAPETAREGSAEVLRQGAGETSPIALIGPPPGATAQGATADLAWAALPRALGYTVLVLDERGDIELQADSSEPRYRLALPSAAADGPRTVYWFVEARLPDGTSVASEVRPLVLVGAPDRR